MKISLIAVICLVPALAFSAPGVELYQPTTDSLRAHLSVLAADSLEGRRVGEDGEWKAAQYIKSVFEAAGLQPKGADGTWFQPFGFVKEIAFGENNRLVVNGVELKLQDEFQPMKQSASAAFDFNEIVNVDYGIKTEPDDGAYNDYAEKDVAGKAVIIKRYAPGSEDNPHVDFSAYESLTSKINTALDHDVAGIFFITPEDHDDTLHAIGPVRITPKDIPITFLRRNGLTRLGLSLSRPQIDAAAGEIELLKVRDTGYNVLGYVPGATDNTIIIGAHYDHLGWGGRGSGSRYLGEEPMIHNGADDNGSGTAVLLELARQTASARDHLNHSYLFAAFSGEEFGILGSSHFARDMTIDSANVLMMINMDMVGRLAEQENGLAVMGTGTTEAFTTYFDSLSRDDVKITQKKSGQGPSDHTAFYNRGIPVLMFFTGPHNDYHKPEDDIEKIDFDGLLTVSDVVGKTIEYFDSYEGVMTFVRTKDPGAGKRRSSFSVTLGIMPDYITEVRGLKIDNVSPDGPADKAGLLAGDIVIRMGDVEVGDIYDYMNALGKFRKGDTVLVTINRSGETTDATVIF